MTFYYTARGTFDKSYDEDGMPWKKEEMSWEKYLQWSKLTHLKELVSVDGMLNESLVEPDYDHHDDWNYIAIHDNNVTGFFTSLAYVLRKMEPRKRFNLLAVVIEPPQDCIQIRLQEFEFWGYDLLGKEYGNRALSNCGGFDETFLPADLNLFGLIDDYEKAYDVKRRLLQNNPAEHHADTNVIAIWRHVSIGRTPNQ